MKKFNNAMRMALVLMLVCGLVFPLALTGLANLVFPKQAQGSLVYHENEVVGSKLIAQDFKDDRYLMGRPYFDQDGVSGSNNWAVGSKEYEIELNSRINAFLEKNPGVSVSSIPMELITESGSSLDPHISVEGAIVQVERMALLSHLDKRDLVQIINDKTDVFGLVNVLEVNLEIDKLLR